MMPRWDILYTPPLPGSVGMIMMILVRPGIHEVIGSNFTLIEAVNKYHNTDEAVTIIETMIRYGASVHAKGITGWTVLHQAALFCCTKVMKLLINAGADVNQSDYYGRTPLHLIPRCGNNENKADGIALIVEKGGDVNHRDANGDTPLISAVACGCIISVRALIIGGADRTIISKDGRIAADEAILRGHDAIAHLLSQPRMCP